MPKTSSKPSNPPLNPIQPPLITPLSAAATGDELYQPSTLISTQYETLWKYSGHTAEGASYDRPYGSLPNSPKTVVSRNKPRTPSFGAQQGKTRSAYGGLNVVASTNGTNQTFESGNSSPVTTACTQESPTMKASATFLPSSLESDRHVGPTYLGSLAHGNAYNHNDPQIPRPSSAGTPGQSTFHLPYSNHLRDTHTEIACPTDTVMEKVIPISSKDQRIGILDTHTFFSESQKMAYAAICYLLMRKHAVFVQDSTTSTAKASASYSAWTILMMNRLYEHLDITEREREVVEQLVAHKIDPEDVANAFRPPRKKSIDTDQVTTDTRRMTTDSTKTSQDQLPVPDEQRNSLKNEYSPLSPSPESLDVEGDDLGGGLETALGSRDLGGESVPSQSSRSSTAEISTPSQSSDLTPTLNGLNRKSSSSLISTPTSQRQADPRRAAVSRLVNTGQGVPRYLVSTLFPREAGSKPTVEEEQLSPSTNPSTPTSPTSPQTSETPNSATAPQSPDPLQDKPKQESGDSPVDESLDLRPILITDLFLLLAKVRADFVNENDGGVESIQRISVWMDYDARSRVLVHNVGRTLGMPIERILYIECWIAEYMAWAKISQMQGNGASDVKIVISQQKSAAQTSKRKTPKSDQQDENEDSNEAAAVDESVSGDEEESQAEIPEEVESAAKRKKRTWKVRRNTEEDAASKSAGWLAARQQDLSSATSFETAAVEDPEESKNKASKKKGVVATRRTAEVDFDVDLATPKKRRKKNRYVALGLATLGGGLILGLSTGFVVAPAIAPLIGAGLSYTGLAGAGTFVSGAGGVGILTTAGTLAGSRIAQKRMLKRTRDVTYFELRQIPSTLPLIHSRPPHVVITIGGWLAKTDEDPSDLCLPFQCIDGSYGEHLSLIWEPEMLQELGSALKILASEALSSTLQQLLGVTALHAVMAALALPIGLVKLGYLVDNPWSNGLDRARLSGEILAECIMRRERDGRPVTLIGYSLGARVIWFCLLALQKRGQYGVVDSAYLFGNPVTISEDEVARVSAVVCGRVVNGFARNDWILGYLFRATTGGLSTVAGLTKIESESAPNLENVDLTGIVNGHLMYRVNLPQVLRHIGVPITLDEELDSESSDEETSSAPDLATGGSSSNRRRRSTRADSAGMEEGYTSISTGDMNQSRNRTNSAEDKLKKKGQKGFLSWFKLGKKSSKDDQFIATTEWIEAEFKQRNRAGHRPKKSEIEEQHQQAKDPSVAVSGDVSELEQSLG